MDRQDEQDTKTDEVPQHLNIDDATRHLYAEGEKLYGEDRQYDRLIAECSELITAMCQYRYGSIPFAAVIDEMVHVQIMIEQALLIGKATEAETHYIKRRKIVLGYLELELENSRLKRLPQNTEAS